MMSIPKTKSLDTTTMTSSEIVPLPLGFSHFVFVNDGREQLLELLPPKYPNVLANHCTHDFGVTYAEHVGDSRAFSSKPEIMTFYGYLDDGVGREYYLVDIDGKKNRPDGRLYHIAWSTGPEKRDAEIDQFLNRRHYPEVKDVKACVSYWWEHLNK